MMRWSVKKWSAACSFGVKLLLLGGTLVFLSLAGFLQSPSESTQSEALPVPQAGSEPSLGRLLEESPVTVDAVGRVDINRSSVEELQSLPGIGPVLANRILRYRNENQNFMSIQDIRNVKGIGVKRFARLRPYIRVAQEETSSNEYF